MFSHAFKSLDTVVKEIGDVNIAGEIDGNGVRLLEFARFIPTAANCQKYRLNLKKRSFHEKLEMRNKILALIFRTDFHSHQFSSSYLHLPLKILQRFY